MQFVHSSSGSHGCCVYPESVDSRDEYESSCIQKELESWRSALLRALLRDGPFLLLSKLCSRWTDLSGCGCRSVLWLAGAGSCSAIIKRRVHPVPGTGN